MTLLANEPTVINESSLANESTVELSIESRFEAIFQRMSLLEKRFQKIVEGKSQYIAIAPKEEIFNNKDLEAHPLDDACVSRCKKACYSLQLESARFHYVPSNYYQTPLTNRRDLLKAPSIHHLCKSIILENTHCTQTDCSDPRNSRYYILMLQYTRKLDADRLTSFVRDMNNIGKRNFVFRLAEEQDSDRLSGYTHNAVTPIGMLTNIPIIFDASILHLRPETIWFGGGHVDVKLQADVDELMAKLKPFVADVTVPKES